jgi:hypothetical protein
MKYLCLICIDEKHVDGMTTGEYGTVMNQCLAYEEELRQRGNLIAVEALQSVQTATTVRVRGGERSVTDGPFAETKEQVAGFFLIDARDLDEAIDVAAKMPQSRIGSIEVRPIQDLTQHRRALQ